MKNIIIVCLALISVTPLSAREDNSRKQKKQKKAKQDTTQQHWHGDGKNWPADTIHHMILGKDSINKY